MSGSDRAASPRGWSTGVVALVVVLVALIGGGTWFALRYFLDQRLDQQLQSTVSNGVARADFRPVQRVRAGPAADRHLARRASTQPTGSVSRYAAAAPGLEPLQLTELAADRC